MRDFFNSDRQDGGPVYPALAPVEKWRRLASKAGSVSAMDPADRRAYAEGVYRALKAAQDSSLSRELPAAHRSCNCASGSFANTPKAIFAANRARVEAEFNAAVRRDRASRTEEQIRELYRKAMAAKAPIPAAKPIAKPAARKAPARANLRRAA